MSKEKKNTMAPKLRFPEFREAGEWEEKTLEEVGEVLMCKRIFSEETNDKEGVPFYKIGTLGGNPDAYISKKLFEEYKSKYRYPRKGEILITCSGTVGKCLTYNGEEAYYQDSNIVWIDNPSLEIKNELLFYMLSNVNWGKLNSTTITRIYGSDLRNLTIVFPKSPIEQKKIAATLSSLDDLIAAQSEKIKALQTHKKGLMQQLFPAEGETVPRVRFAEFREAGEWEEMQFGEICKFTRGPFGGALKKEIFVKDGYAVYEQSHAIHKDFDSFRYYITEEKFNELKRFSVLPNDIIMSCSGTMGKFAIVPKESKKGIINQALLKLTVIKEHELGFIKATLELSSNQEKLLSQSAGGAIKNVVSVGQIKEIDLYIPKLKEQQKIADCLSSLDDLITAQSQKLEALKAHKKGLMQGLFPNPNEEEA